MVEVRNGPHPNLPARGEGTKVERRAFAEAIKNDDVRALWNHDPGEVLGRMKNGTLSLSEDDTGLAFEIDVAETTVGNDALVSIRRGDVDQMSFSFGVQKDEWTQERSEELPTRRLIKASLSDVSPVTFPAYPDTDVAVRSLETWRGAGLKRGQTQGSAPTDGDREIGRRRRELDLMEAEG